MQYPYLCRSLDWGTKYKKQFKLSTKKTNAFSYKNGDSACGKGYAFLPPDDPELVIAALQKIAPNHPRYPFPNPFRFQDGIPFRTSKGKLSFKYAELEDLNDFVASSQTDSNYIFSPSTAVPVDNKALSRFSSC